MNATLHSALADAFSSYATGRLGDCVENIERCAGLLSLEQVWQRPNEVSNSVGNLVLHLAGNVRQWMISGVGGQADVRKRNMEFAARGGATAAGMLAGLDATLRETDEVLRNLLPSELLERRSIQGRDTTVMEAVYHVVEHFAGHTGQIIWITKQLTAGRAAIEFYPQHSGE